MSTQNLPSGTTQKPAAELGAKPVQLLVSEEHAGQRLDNFLITLLKGVPKTHIYKIIRKGEVRINGGRVKQITRLKEGDLLRVPPLRMTENRANPEELASRFSFLRSAVLFEDEAVLVLNKPAGMAVHAGSGIKTGVIEALRAVRSELPYLELAHRLDRETSGCLVLAKKMSVLRQLNQDFAANSSKNKRLDKRYIALVQGFWRHGERRVSKPLDTESRRAGERYVTVSEKGSYAASVMRPLQRSKVASLIEVALLTGRTHQVRVHAQAEGHPLAGDARYGDAAFNKLMRDAYSLKRLFLHAAELSFQHPLSKSIVTVKAPLPEELERVISDLAMQRV